MYRLTVLLCLASTIGGLSQKTHFIQTKQDLLLDVTEEIERNPDTIFAWKFDKNNIVRLVSNKILPSSDYKDRVEFISQNFSLVLKHVQLSDTGIYTAVLIGDKDVTLAEYKVIVEDPVSPVTVTVDSVSNSSESCNFTVSCSTEGLHLRSSFTCNNQTCDSQEDYGTTTPSGAHLHLHLSNVSVICNHSNNVSQSQDMKDYRQACQAAGNHGSENRSAHQEIWPFVVGLAVAGGVFIFIIAAVYYRKRRRRARVNMENTVYELPNTSPPQTATTLEAPLDSPTSTYSLVGPHHGPAPATDTREAPESLYATVNKPTRP